LKIRTLFQVVQGRKDFAKVLMSVCKEVEGSTAIGEGRQQVLHKLDLSANVGCVSRLGRSASNLFLLLSKRGESRKNQKKNQREKNSEEAHELHHETFDAADGCALPGLASDK
jgi:hypothetical protein